MTNRESEVGKKRPLPSEEAESNQKKKLPVSSPTKTGSPTKESKIDKASNESNSDTVKSPGKKEPVEGKNAEKQQSTANAKKADNKTPSPTKVIPSQFGGKGEASWDDFEDDTPKVTPVSTPKAAAKTPGTGIKPSSLGTFNPEHPVTPNFKISNVTTFGSGFSKFSDSTTVGFGTQKSDTSFSSLLAKKDDKPAAVTETPTKKLANLGLEPVNTSEDSKNQVYSTRGKLFCWQDEEYKERGLGTFKILKMDEGGHQIVMRTDGVHRVILNVRVHKAMPINLRNDKYLEFLASEKQGELTKFLLKLKNNDVATKLEDELIAVIPKAK
ncbi:hypothetical protein HK103_004272 [Boothiomyces macroporosus]|uniref:RanBD1 domain-containing protein n=1 Tax=Boothiomyces macroporosus TaxID=261099 RepID=A0AAD5UKM1_9FUNG|nr:hypothetical protein HK103_004272 [Boothiomyces macroporosus]